MKNKQISRRRFISKGVNTGIGLSLSMSTGIMLLTSMKNSYSGSIFHLKKGEKQIFVDNKMLSSLKSIQRKTHIASKLEIPVLEADMSWEQGEIYNGIRDRRIYIFGTVLHNKDANTFRMWYNRFKQNYYAISNDGINWHRPNLNKLGENNQIELFDFDSPSIIKDDFEPNPAKRYNAHYKAVGYTNQGYCAAYSADGINWKRYTKNPILISGDTITLAQDPVNGEYLAFHKVNNDPRVNGRQVFLSISKDMQNWSEPYPVMVTDEIDHIEARKLEGGTHSEFYNMSAFPYANQWLGMVTHFRRTGEPKKKIFNTSGHRQSFDEGPIDVQLVHSRDGRNWERCSDRTPIIPLGPYEYDSGSILGLCNSPVIVGDEMWMYYTAMTTPHGGYVPEKVMSIARASWKIDRLVSMQSKESKGLIETVPLLPDGKELYVNVNTKNGNLMVEVVDLNREVIPGYEMKNCKVIKVDSVKQKVIWNNNEKLPENKPFCIRFTLENGDLFSYLID